MFRSLRLASRVLGCAQLLSALTGAQVASTTTPEYAGAKDCDPPIAHLVLDSRAAQSWSAAAGALPPAPGTRQALGSLHVTQVEGGSAPEGDSPAGMTFTPDGSQILVAHWQSRNVVVWDATTGALVRTIAVTGSPYDVAVTPDGLRAVTANGRENTASILDLVTGTEIARLNVGVQPGVVEISPDGTLAAIAGTGSFKLSIVDIATATELRRLSNISCSNAVSVGIESASLAARFGRCAFAGNTKIVNPDYFSDSVKIIDVASGAVTIVPVASGPEALVVSADGNTAVVSCSTADALVVVDIPSATVTKTIPVGANVRSAAVTINPQATQAAVVVSNGVRVVDLVTNAVSPHVDAGEVDELYTTSDGLYAFCVGLHGSLVSLASGTIVKNLNDVVSIGRGAVSPVGPRAAGVAALLGEDLLVFDTNGAAGGLVYHKPSGPGPEGDKARMLTFSRDGSKLGVTHILSDTLGIHDAASGALLHEVHVGDRPAEVEFTRDGTLAVVANMDSTFASVVDVASGTTTDVPISTRAHQVEISPDGAYAYLVTGVDDGVWRIDLATKTVAGPELPCGDTGSVGMLYAQTSGLTLSHDGATLAVCGSFNNRLTLIDTASWSVVADLLMHGFPARAIFDATDEHILVSCRDDDVVKVLTNAGAASTVIATYDTGSAPLELALTIDSKTLFVGSYVDTSVRAIRTSTGATVGGMKLPDYFGGMALSTDGAELYVATGNWTLNFFALAVFGRNLSGWFSVFNTQTFALERQVETRIPPGTMAYDYRSNRCAVASPFVDGYYVVDLPNRRGPRVQ
jgi:YVTN family beta-propeller protein